jgi:hypothetical protein
MSAQVCVVQWAAEDVGGLSSLALLPAALSAVAAWTTSGGAPSVAVDTGGAVAAGVVHVNYTAGQHGAVVVTFSADAVRRGITAAFPLTGLRTRATYALRASCNGVGDRMGPVVPSSPGRVTPAPPLITAVTVPTVFLGTSGGSVVRVTGVQLGGVGAVVLLGLSNGVHTFPGAPCAVTAPGVEVRCEAPIGVGSRHAAWVEVDGVASAPFPNATLSYAPPSIATITVLRAVGDEGGNAPVGVSTEGGSVVVIAGANFGPATGITPTPLGAVTYTPPDFVVGRGVPVSAGLWAVPARAFAWAGFLPHAPLLQQGRWYAMWESGVVQQRETLVCSVALTD